ncbi:MAG: aldolase/citrate lyase family protein [Chloroflexota bacterium]
MLLRSWLYAPGNNEKLLGRVFGAGADAVILDLEDAVPAAQKFVARSMVAATVAQHVHKVDQPELWVRVNHPETGLTAAEIEAVVQPGLDGVRLPKTESVATVIAVDEWLSRAEERAEMAAGSVGLVCGVETARGIWYAHEIASASARVRALSFGGADFTRDVGVTVGNDGLEVLYARSRLVLASRVAGIQPPIDGVYTLLQDDAGLERTTREARALGFGGRACLHPRQVPVVNRVFSPSEDELGWAREVLSAATQASQSGYGTLQLTGGEFVDVAIVRRAERLLELAQRRSPARRVANEGGDKAP